LYALPIDTTWFEVPFIELLREILLLHGVALAAAFLVVSRHSVGPDLSLGLRRRHRVRDMCRGVLLQGAAMPALMALMYGWHVILDRTGQQQQLQRVVQLLADPQPTVLLVASGALTVVVAPILEEVIFRGFVMATLIRRVGPVLGIIGSAAFFGILHGWPACVPIFAVGLLFGYLYWRTGSLWVSIGCHAAFNAVNLVSIRLLSEQVTNGLQAPPGTL
jgi:membrane protease YdiL (CAAX protease family)